MRQTIGRRKHKMPYSLRVTLQETGFEFLVGDYVPAEVRTPKAETRSSGSQVRVCVRSTVHHTVHYAGCMLIHDAEVVLFKYVRWEEAAGGVIDIREWPGARVRWDLDKGDIANGARFWVPQVKRKVKVIPGYGDNLMFSYEGTDTPWLLRTYDASSMADILNQRQAKPLIRVRAL